MKNRIVLHLDMNSYFASMEQQANPLLRGKPIGVAGKPGSERTVITAFSIEAKKFGLSSGMNAYEAKRLCPQLIIVPANYNRYIFTSKRIFAILEKFSPAIDIFSIDEAFIALDKWEDWSSAEQIARQIKLAIRQAIGQQATCSVGISYGKVMAKLASKRQKPDGLTIIRPEDFATIARGTAIQEICGIGPRLGPRLNRLGIFTLADLGRTTRNLLTSVFGLAAGTWLYELGQGRDNGEIRSFRHLPQEKSVSHAYTLPHDLSQPEEIKEMILLLAERVGEDLRSKGLAGRCVSLFLRSSHFTGWGQSVSQKAYIADGYQIYQVAANLLNSASLYQPIRLIGVAISDLVKQSLLPKPLLPYMIRTERLSQAVDRLNSRHGRQTVYRAATANWRRRVINLPDGRQGRYYAPNG